MAWASRSGLTVTKGVRGRTRPLRRCSGETARLAVMQALAVADALVTDLSDRGSGKVDGLVTA